MLISYSMLMNPFTDDYHQGMENLSKLAPNKQLAFSQRSHPEIEVECLLQPRFRKVEADGRKRIGNEDTDTGILSGSK